MTQQPHPLFKEWLHRLETENEAEIRTDSYLSQEGDDGRQCFCALGLAADVLVQHGIGEWRAQDTGLYAFSVDDMGIYRFHIGGLSNFAFEQMGLRLTNHRDFNDFVAGLNDPRSNGKHVHTWPEIADRIREYVKEESN